MFDENNDAYVYQDWMLVNVISDKPGLCPNCFMQIDRVSINEAR